MPAMVDLSGVSYSYGSHPVLERINLRIGHGELVGLVGPSGAGKTTMLRLMLGELQPTGGRVQVAGAGTGARRRLRIGYVPQVETVDWNFPVTVEQVVLMGRWREMGPWPWPTRHDRAQVRELLERLGIGALARQQIAALSGGQQQRVFLARALSCNPQMLVLDEPTASLDMATRSEILQLLLGLHQGGLTVVLTTHELDAVAAQLMRVVCLNRRIIADGPPEVVLTPERLQHIFGAPAATAGRPQPARLAPIGAPAGSRQGGWS